MGVQLRHVFTWGGIARLSDGHTVTTSLAVLDIYRNRSRSGASELVWLGTVLPDEHRSADLDLGVGSELSISIGSLDVTGIAVVVDDDGGFAGEGPPPLPAFGSSVALCHHSAAGH